MTQSPSQVSEAQLHELGLDLEPQKKRKNKKSCSRQSIHF